MTRRPRFLELALAWAVSWLIVLAVIAALWALAAWVGGW